MTTTAVLASLATAVAPVRSRHHQLLAEVGRWALARGEPVDLDLIALAVAAAEDDFLGGGGPFQRCTRPGINRFLSCSLSNWCSMQRCLIPDGLMTAVWQLLHFLRDAGQLDPDSDPFERLLEPLQCYGGLGPDGRDAPDGYRPDFPCECYLDVVAPSKPGQSRWRLADGTVIELWRPSPNEPKLFAWYSALGEFSRAVRAERMSRIVHLEDFEVVGKIEPGPGWPELWVYVQRDSQAQLIVNQHGAPFGIRPDRRRKLGFRFESLSIYPAAWRAGLPGIETLDWRANQEAEDEWRDDDVDIGRDASEDERPQVVSRPRGGWR